MEKNNGGMVKLCGLWKKKTSEGKTFYSGGLTYSTNIVLFTNKYKESPDDKKPDLILYIAKKEKKEDKPKEQETDSDSEFPF